MKTFEFSCVFERAQGRRLQELERLLHWVAREFADALVGCDVAWSARGQTLVSIFRFDAGRFPAERRQRLAFWSARSGGRARLATGLTPAENEQLQLLVERCELRAIGLEGEGLERALVELLTPAGLDAARARYAGERPTLTLGVGGHGWEAVRWHDDEETLFIATPLPLPVGDVVPVCVRLPGATRPSVESTRVVYVRGAEEAAPGHPAGIALSFEAAPADFRRALARSAPVAAYGSRTAPRFQLRAPIHAVLTRSGDGAGHPGEEIGWVENVSLGGAFIRCDARPPVGTDLRVRFRLPTSVVFETAAVVVFADAHGVGVRFVLDARGMSALHDALALVSARPRRALVVDDDALARQMVADALVERGFEVLTAGDASEGLHVLTEELLGIDLLVTDLYLPEESGEKLVARIRQAGGESDLVIAVMTGRPDAELARRLGEAGADLLVGKELGPELIALKADGLIEERIAGRSLRRERAQ